MIKVTAPPVNNPYSATAESVCLESSLTMTTLSINEVIGCTADESVTGTDNAKICLLFTRSPFFKPKNRSLFLP